MGTFASFRLFGVGSEVYRYPDLLARRVAQAKALDTDDLALLSSSAASHLGLADPKAQALLKLTTAYRKSFNDSNTAKALEAQQALAALIQGTSETEWQAIVEGAEVHVQTFASHRFGPPEKVAAALRERLETKKDAGLLIAQILSGDTAAFAELNKAIHLHHLNATLQETLLFSEDQPFKEKAIHFVHLLYRKMVQDYIAYGFEPTQDFGVKLQELHQVLTRFAEITELTAELQTILDNLSLTVELIQQETGPQGVLSSFSFGSDTKLISLAYLTLRHHIELAHEKKIHVAIEIPDGVSVDDQDRAEILMGALSEIIKNAIKYSDPAKGEKWIWIRWDPRNSALFVEDNGVGIPDIEGALAGERQAQSLAEGMGFGLGFQRKQLGEYFWNLSLRSTPGVGTTAIIKPIEKDLTISHDYKRFRIRMDRMENYLRKGRYPLSELTPEVVAYLTPEEQIRLSVQLFHQSEKIYLEAREAITNLPNNDRAGLERIRENLFANTTYLEKLFPMMRDSKLKPLIDYLAEATKAIFMWSHSASAALQEFDAGRITWDAMTTRLLSQGASRSYLALDRYGYIANAPQEQITRFFVPALRKSATSESWDKASNSWQLTFPLTSENPPWGMSTWPPDPKNDLVLKTYLQALGWTMTVDTRGDQIVVRVNFGDSTAEIGDKEIAEGDDLVAARLALGRIGLQIGSPRRTYALRDLDAIADGNSKMAPRVKKALEQWTYYGGPDNSNRWNVLIDNEIERLRLAMLLTDFHIEVDIPSSITIPNKGYEGTVTRALGELLQNAFKYRDETKERRWAKVRWNPASGTFTVTDNGRGIENTTTVFQGVREYPDEAPGSGIGLGGVRDFLRSIGWGISVTSTLGVGTIFTLTPAEGAMGAEESYRQELLERQRLHFQTHDRFDLVDLTPPVVARMNDTEKLQLAKQLFEAKTDIAADCYSKMEKLEQGDVAGLTKLYQALRVEGLRLTNLFPTSPADRLNRLFALLLSTSCHLTTRIMDSAEVAAGKFNRQEISWDAVLQFIWHPDRTEEEELVGSHGYRFLANQREIGIDLVLKLRENKPEESWEEGKWILKYPATAPIKIDPENDIVLKTVLELMGWTMTVHSTADATEVRIDFGKNLYENDRRLIPLAKVTSRMQLARTLEAIVEKENRQALDCLRKGEPPSQVIQKFINFLQVALAHALSLDDAQARQNPAWKEDPVADAFLHGLGNSLASLKETAEMSAPHTIPRELLELLLLPANVNELKGAIIKVVQARFYAFARANIKVIVEVPENISLNLLAIANEKFILSINELITNAIKYGAKEIRIAWDSSRKVLTVTDNGIGISNIEVIWQEGPDSRLAKERAPGSGLGLTTVKRQLSEISWQISVESTPGVGTTFTLTPPH